MFFGVMQMISVSSSAIRAIGFDGYHLGVVFRGRGRRYDHPGVPESVFIAFLSAPSKGRFYRRYIRGRY
jgi:hypothetical protein